MGDKPNQRKGAESNAQVGADFQLAAQAYLQSIGLELHPNFPIDCGLRTKLKSHRFDFGGETPKVLVECKSHTWTESGNVPSAKMTTWNEAMLYFAAAPSGYRKILFILRDFNARREETLLDYYLRTYTHLVPTGVEFIEFSPETKVARTVIPMS